MSHISIPIVVGGTGFYTESLLGTMNLPEVAPNIKLRKQLQMQSASQLFTNLQKLDPRRAKEIDPHNKVRLIRAIEVAKALGKVPKNFPASPFEILWLGIDPPQEKLQKNIRARIKKRLQDGMLTETVKLRRSLSKKRYASLGAEFQLLGNFLDKKISKEALLESLEKWELHYAKRQMRWHRRNKNIQWINTQNEALTTARKFLDSRS